MVLRTSINIAPNTLQDLTIDNLDKEGTLFENYYPKVFSRADLESMIFDDIIETDVAAASGDERFTFSSTGFNTIQKTFNELLDLPTADTPLIMTPSNSVSVLSDGTNNYAIKDTQARSDIASLQTNKVPTTRTVNGKALSSDITLTASDVGALPDNTVIPTVNNATLTIQKNGTNVQTFTANASSNVTANITVPTDTSDLTNGAGFITSSDISNMVTTDTNQTITGKKVLGGKDKTMLANANITKGTNPASTQYINFGLFGDTTSSYTDRLGCMETSLDSSGNVTTFLRAYKNEASSSTAGNITVNYPSSGSPYATAPTPTEDTNNSVQIDTVGARNTKLADYVDTSTNQNIGGYKTFTNNMYVNGANKTVIIKNSNMRRNTAPSADVNQTYICGKDSADKNTWAIYHTWSTEKAALTRLICYKGTSTDSTWAGIGVGYDSSGNSYTVAPTPATSDNSTKIATTAYVKAQGYTDNSSNETIGGTKTFTNPPVFNMRCYTAYNGVSNTNQYKKIATAIKTGASTSLIVPFMFCASSSQITSGTYNGKIACRTSSTAGSANTSQTGIVLNGNPDFISNGNIVFYLMYKNNYPESNQVTFEVWVYVKNTYQGVNVMPLRIGTHGNGQDINAMTWGDNMTSTTALPDGFTAINQIIL